MTLEASEYYSGVKALSYNCPITIVNSLRSFGKTYYFKRLGIRHFLKSGETFTYMRRYDEQIKSLLRKRNSFFSDLIEKEEFPGYELRTNGRLMEIKRDTWERWEVCGYFAALNNYENEKSGHDAKNTMIVFDEFIKERKRYPYLDNEVSTLMNYWETLDRRESRVKIIMLGNAADAENPYYLEWKIVIKPDMPEFTRWQNGQILLQYARPSDAFMEHSATSTIGALTAGTSYDRYARLNQFSTVTDEFVSKKPRRARHVCTLEFQGKPLSVWLDAKEGVYHVHNTSPRDGKPVYALTRSDMRPNLIMLHRSEPIIKTLGRMYRYGYVFFDNPRTRELFLAVLQANGQL